MTLRLMSALALVLPCATHAQTAILQLQVIEGEGTVHAPGARNARPLSVAVTDETGKPVSGAAVSFLLPDEGPGGVFTNGLHTEVVTSDEKGRAVLRGLQVNRTAGRFGIRITASKEQARAGIISFQYIAESKGGQTAATGGSRTGSRKLKWYLVAAGAAAGAAVAGLSVGGGSQTAAAAPTQPAAAPPVPTLTIGPPVISVGKP